MEELGSESRIKRALTTGLAVVMLGVAFVSCMSIVLCVCVSFWDSSDPVTSVAFTIVLVFVCFAKGVQIWQSWNPSSVKRPPHARKRGGEAPLRSHRRS